MKKILITLFLILIANLLFAYNITCEKGLDKYKDLVDKEIVPVLNDVVNAREEAIKLFESSEVMAEEISYLLSCEDIEDYVLLGLSYNLYDSKVLCTTLQNIKIMSYEEAKKKNTIQTGYICYEFVENDGVNLVFSPMVSNVKEDDFYLPILINKKGEIVKKKEIIDGILSVGGNNSVKGPLMILDNINEIITKKLGIEFPFGRWYNEGMNYKVTSIVLHKVNSPLAQDFDNLFKVSEESKQLKDKVNLWDFPQVNLISVDDYPMELSTANIQYSCELMDKIYNKVGREGIHRLNTEMKFAEMLSNDDICKMANNVLKLDLKPMIEEYIPNDIKPLINKEKRNEAETEARKLMDNRQYKEAIPILTNILAADPYNLSIRFNLAKCYRLDNNSIESDKIIFLAANASIPGTETISFYGQDDVINLIIYGKYLFMSEVFDSAEQILKQAYEIDKSPDIKQILDSIELTKENNRKALYGGN